MPQSQDHYDWESVTVAANLPNAAGSPTQSAKLIAGHRCYVSGPQKTYVCTDPTPGAAVWVQADGSGNDTTLTAWDGDTLAAWDTPSLVGLWGTTAKAEGSHGYGLVKVVGDALVLNPNWGTPMGITDGESFAISVDGGAAQVISLTRYTRTHQDIFDLIDAVLPGVAYVSASPQADGVPRSLLTLTSPTLFTGSISLCNVVGTPLQKMGLTAGVWRAASAELTVGDELFRAVDGGQPASAPTSAFASITFSAEQLGVNVNGAGVVNVTLNGALSPAGVAAAVNAAGIPQLWCYVQPLSGQAYVVFETLERGDNVTLAFTDVAGTPIAKLGIGSMYNGNRNGSVPFATTATLNDVLGDLNAPGTFADDLDGARIIMRSDTVGAASSLHVTDMTYATGRLTTTANFLAGETVTVASTTYTFENPIISAGDVLLGADALASLNNLAAAINRAAGAGTLYITPTTPDPVAVAISPAGVLATNYLRIIDASWPLLAGQTVTVGAKTYTFVASLGSANDVLLGSNVGATLSNLTAAINAGAGAGTVYHASTTANAQVTAELTPQLRLKVTAKPAYAGVAGNAVATSTTVVDTLTWQSSTLRGGAEHLDVTTVAPGVLGNTVPTTAIAASATWGAATMTGAIGTPAMSVLTVSPNVVAGDTVTIGTKTYTFVAASPSANGEVLVGATILDTYSNLAAAVNLAAGSGTLYAAATTENAHALAVWDGVASVLIACAKYPGVDGDTIPVGATGGNAVWSSATLVGGAGGTNSVEASGALRATANFSAAETLTIGSKVYTFVAAPPAAGDGNVAVGASLGASLENLTKAINLTGVAGTHYGTGTTAHPDVTATAVSSVAAGVLTGTSNFSDTETVTLGTKVYTFQAVLTNVDGNVLIGATLQDSLSNLERAIVLGSGAGTDYATLMTANTDAVSTGSDATTLSVSAALSGVAGNVVATTTTAANAAWGSGSLQGGGTYGVDVVAQVGGVMGDAIATTDTAANAAWVAPTLEGGRGGAPRQCLGLAATNAQGVNQDPTWTVVTDPELPGGKALRFYSPGAENGTATILFADAVAPRPMKLSAAFLPVYPFVTQGGIRYGVGMFVDTARGTSHAVGVSANDAGVYDMGYGRTNGPYPATPDGASLGAINSPVGQLTLDLVSAGLTDAGHPVYNNLVTHASTGVPLITSILSVYPLGAHPPIWDGATVDRHGLFFTVVSKDPVTVYVLNASISALPG